MKRYDFDLTYPEPDPFSDYAPGPHAEAVPCENGEYVSYNEAQKEIAKLKSELESTQDELTAKNAELARMESTLTAIRLDCEARVMAQRLHKIDADNETCTARIALNLEKQSVDEAMPVMLDLSKSDRNASEEYEAAHYARQWITAYLKRREY